MWTSVVHNTAVEHEWVIGKCKHGALEDRDDYLEDGSVAHVKLANVVQDPQFLRKTIHYVNCRSTAALESFQNLRICYAAKRQAYQFEAYTARNQLAALDHMADKDRPIKTKLGTAQVL